MKYTVVKELKSTARYNKYIELKDLMFVLAYFCFAYLMGALVYEKLKIFFYIYSISCALFLIMRSAENPTRKNYQRLLIMLQKDKSLYRPIMPRRRKEREGNI